MKLELNVVDSLLNYWWPRHVECKIFLQMQVNRLLVGSQRYGRPKKSQKYLTRLTKELRAYRKTGNMEQLINIANYALLESIAPENPRFHFDATAESVTRETHA